MSRVTFPNARVASLAALVALSWLVSHGGDCLAQQPLGFNNVVVLQSGNGINPLSTTTGVVSLKEFTPGGSLVQTIAVPSSGAGTKLTIVGNSASEGTLSISPDGKWIAFGGYDSGTGVSGVTSNTAVSRVAGILNTTTGTYSVSPMGSGFRASTATSIRGAATNDGNNIWAIGGAQGLVYGTVTGGTGSFGTISSGLPTNYNAISVYSGTSTNLFATCTQGASNPRLGTFGPSVLPTGTATSFTVAPGLPSAGTVYSGFVFLDTNSSIPGLDTLYVADASANAQGGIWKYSLGLSGTWTGAGQISTPVALRGLSGFVSGSNVRLFTTSASTLYTYWDANATTSTLSGTTSDLTSIATAPLNTAFRGVVVVPEPSTVALLGAGIAGIGGMQWVRRRLRRRCRNPRKPGAEANGSA